MGDPGSRKRLRVSGRSGGRDAEGLHALTRTVRGLLTDCCLAGVRDLRGRFGLRTAAVALLVPLGACGADADETSRSSDTATDLDAACAEIAAAVPRGDDVEIEVSNDSFPAFVGSGQRFGCVVQVAGRTTPEQPVPALVTTFAESLGPGW